MHVIPQDALLGIKEMITKRFEVCGILIQTDKESKYPEFYPFVDAVGKTIKGRNSCIHPRYGQYIWHTHSETMKGYPSGEDIIKIIKKRELYFQIRSSIIFTSWGIWEIFSKNKVTINPNMQKYIIKMISPLWNGIYHITKRGRTYYPKINNFLHSIIDEICRFINNKFERVDLGLEISFVSWNDIGELGYIIRR